MGQLDYLFFQKTQGENNSSNYPCPLCGHINQINSTDCGLCRYNLTEYESIYFYRWNKYNEALFCAKSEDLITALENVTQFLEYYPKDKDAQRLRLFLLQRMGDKFLDKKAEDYIRNESDRWAVQLLDEPEKTKLDEFCVKNNFKGKLINSSFNQRVEIQQRKNIATTNSLIEIINILYAMSCSINVKDKSKKFGKRFDSFYQHTFLKFLVRQELRIVDYYGQNYFKLSEEQRKSIGEVVKVKGKKSDHGLIVSIYQPEIHYYTLIVQRAKIGVVSNYKLQAEGKQDA